MNTKDKQNLPPIFLVSGGKGLAGHTMVQSLLIQYPENIVPVHIKPNVQSIKKIREVVSEAAAERALITHTMVNRQLRKALIEECASQGVAEIDFMGPLANYLEEELGLESKSVPGLYRRINARYFDRIDAMEFTLANDDGINPKKIRNAEIILTGVSRAGKTPLSMYMSMFGWRVANIPLVLGIDPPKELFEVDPRKVFGLRISAVHLIAQRAKRLKNIKNTSNTSYIDQRRVNDEIRFAERIFEQGRFTVINVTNKPVETSANEIIGIIADRFNFKSGKVKDVDD